MSKRPLYFDDYSKKSQKSAKKFFKDKLIDTSDKSESTINKVISKKCLPDDTFTSEGNHNHTHRSQIADMYSEEEGVNIGEVITATASQVRENVRDQLGVDESLSVLFESQRENPNNMEKFNYDDEYKYDEDSFDGEEDLWSDARSQCDSESESEPSEKSDLKDDLYFGARMSVLEFLLCISALQLRHKLTNACISDILKLISTILTAPNNCPTSFYKFKKFFNNFSVPIIRHPYCSNCVALMPNTSNDSNDDDAVECEQISESLSNCECNEGANINYFIEIPLIPQLETFFRRDGFYNKLNFKNNFENMTNDSYNDIYDGTIYKNAREKKLWKNNSLTFMWYTDGIQIFRSSKYSVWGFFLVILELPYQYRYKIENIILVGLWYGDKKPNPNVFLEPLIQPLKSLYRGIKLYVKDLNDFITIQGLITCGSCDLPAKALFLNMTQYNGRFGCQVCKDKGRTVDRTRVYDYKENMQLRTDEETILHASQATQINKPVCGVKGFSVMSKICYNCVTSTAVDVMHCVFEGVVKKLGELWFDTKYGHEIFSISNLVDVVDYRLCNIKPPSYVSRRPRPIKTHFSYWKASEYKNWFFYYSLPVLYKILPDDYIDHYKLLLLAIYILCQTSVSKENVDFAEKLIREFLLRFESLYSVKFITCNFHSLRHLPEVVRRTGPLWTTSCFPLEDLNGKLKSLVRSSNSAHLQIAFNLSMHVTVHTLKHELLQKSTEVFNYCDSLLESRKKLKLTKIADLLYISGPLRKLKNHDVRELIRSYNLPGTNVFVFKALYKNKILYTAESTICDRKTKTFVVKYYDVKNMNFSLGAIQKFVRITDCDCKYVCECSSKHFAIINKFNSINPFSVAIEKRNLDFIHQYKKSVKEIEAIEVENLKCVCYCIEFEQSSLFYAIEPVNMLECE